MEEISVSSEEEVQFEQDQVVWAKITGHPWWPATITALPNKRNTSFRVDFFADNTHAFVAPSKVAKYQQLRSEIDLHKHMKKGLRKAIVSADQALVEQLGDTIGADAACLQEGAPQLTQKQLSDLPSIKSTQLQEKKQQEQKLQVISQEDHPSIQQQLHSQQPQSFPQDPTPPQYSHEQREKYVNQLLKKYQLNSLDSRDRQEKSKKHSRGKQPLRNKRLGQEFRRTCSKTKRISKVHHFGPTLLYALSRRLDKFLRSKAELSPAQRKLINISLSKQIQSRHHPRIESAIQEITKLFKWLQISPSSTIAAYYESWSSFQSEKEKASNMTTEE